MRSSMLFSFKIDWNSDFIGLESSWQMKNVSSEVDEISLSYCSFCEKILARPGFDEIFWLIRQNSIALSFISLNKGVYDNSMSISLPSSKKFVTSHVKIRPSRARCKTLSILNLWIPIACTIVFPLWFALFWPLSYGLKVMVWVDSWATILHTVPYLAKLR